MDTDCLVGVHDWRLSQLQADEPHDGGRGDFLIDASLRQIVAGFAAATAGVHWRSVMLRTGWLRDVYGTLRSRTSRPLFFSDFLFPLTETCP